MTLRGQETKLLNITKVASGDTSYRFTSLASLLNEEHLERSFHELNKHRASGIDGVSLEEYGSELKENIHNLCERAELEDEIYIYLFSSLLDKNSALRWANL